MPLHANFYFSHRPARERFSLRSRKRPFSNDAVSAAEDGVGFSFGIREEFTCLCQEFGQASLVLKFESERMVGEGELVVNLICAATKFPCLQAAKAVCRIQSGVVGFAEASLRTVLCVFIAIYSFFCRLAVSSNCDGVVYNL
jgi:hypothetical protein